MWECYPHVHGLAICEVDPNVKKIDIPLLSKTLVSKIDRKNDPFSMDPKLRATPSTPDFLNPTESMACQYKQRTSFYRTLNPTSYRLSGTPVESLLGGIEWKPCIKTGFQ